MNVHMLEMHLSGVGTVLSLERDAWSMIKRLRQATFEYPPPTPTPAAHDLFFVAVDHSWRSSGHLCVVKNFHSAQGGLSYHVVFVARNPETVS